MSFSNVPCPPYYSVPTHQSHPHYSQNTYVRQYNDWYECLTEPYCNSPTFLGYNPPGGGDKWTEAWKLLEGDGYPCNPNLATSSSSSSNTNGGSSSSSNGNNNNPLFNNPFSLTPRPTSRPTTIKETPSLISGAIWYDANGDGLQNTIQNALTTADREAAANERGAGVGNMKITLRNCDNDALLGVTYTFPRQSSSSSSGGVGNTIEGSSSSGGIQIVDTAYLDGITQQQQFELNGDTASILGFGNTNNLLGYYSFRVLPSDLPGNFYVVMEAPEGYRLTAGSGEYWEVQEAEMNDLVQPVLEAEWEKKKKNDDDDDDDGQNRYLQENGGEGVNTTAMIDGNDSTSFSNATINNVENDSNNNGTAFNNNNNFDIPIIPSTPLSTPDKIKPKQINHSGYYARSKNCIYIKESPTTITNINYGLTKDSWPLNSFQYASFVIMIEFFDATRIRRGLQGVDSLECRKYQKLKGEGVDIEDIWGCETTLDIGGGKQYDFTELNVEQADLVVNSITEYLLSRAPRTWSVTNVHLAWQEVVEFNIDTGDGDERGLLQSDDTNNNNNNNQHNRALQNQQLAQLELGMRIRAEFQSDKAKTQDLTDVIMASIDASSTTLLSVMKANVNVMPPYFRYAGGLSMRRIMWKPPTPSPTPVPPPEDVFPGSIVITESPTAPPIPEIGQTQLMMIIGVVAALVVVVAGAGIIVGMYVWRKRKSEMQQNRRQGMPFDGYDDDDSLSSRWYSDYEGSDRGEDDQTDYAEEDSFGEFDESGANFNLSNPDNVRGSMRVSFKESAPSIGSMRSSFQSQRSGSQRSGSQRGSVRGSMRSSMRSQSSARSSMQSSGSGRSSASMRSTAMASMRSSTRSMGSAAMSARSMGSAAMSTRSMRSSSRSMHSAAAMSSRSLRSSGRSSRRSSGEFSSARSELGPIT